MYLMATKEIVEERKAICNNCDRNKLNICLECKCFIPMKVSFSAAKCPLDKWQATDQGELIS